MTELYPSKWHEKFYHSERIIGLIDGVYAIVLTLLVLDLRIPHLTKPDSISELWAETKGMISHFWSFLITFLWIANMWVSGQNYRRLLVKSDAVVIWLDIFMLLLVCLLPFPTAIIGLYPHNPLGVIYFGVLTVIGGMFVIAYTQYTVRKNYVSPLVDLEALRKDIGVIPKLLPVYLVPIIIAFWSPIAAQIIYFLLGASWIFQTNKFKLKSDSSKISS